MYSQKNNWRTTFNIFFLPFLFVPCLFAQHVSTPDSLKQLIQHAKTDTAKVKYFNALALSLGCSDSANKLNAAKEALQLSVQIKWNPGIADANFIIGYYYGYCQRNYGGAITYLQEGISVARKCNDKYREALGLGYMAEMHANMGQYGKTIAYYKEVLNVDVNQDLKTGAFSNIGEAYAKIGLYKTALDYYDSALQGLNTTIGAKKDNKLFDSKALLKITIGDIYLTNGDNKSALTNYNNALELFEKTKNKDGIVLALTALGKANQAEKNYEKAIEYYNRVLNEYKEEIDRAGEYKLIIYNQLGKLYLEKGMIDMAMDYSQRSLQLIKDYPNDAYAPVTYNILGEVCIRQKKYDMAVSYLTKAIDQCKKTGALDNEKNALLTLTAAYEQMNKPVKAYEVYKKYIKVRDSVYSIDKAKEITKYELTSDFKEKQALLSAEQDKKTAIQNAVIELTLKRQHLAYIAFTVIILLLLLVGGLVYNRSKLNEKLQMQIAIASERSRISAEMHDDLGSELSKISLLSEIVKDNVRGQSSASHLDSISKSSKELVDKMGEIVWSLNNKYDSLESLVIYIRKYAMEFFSSTDIDCKVAMPEHIPPVTLEGEERRNIFLIVKEALHNALKHARADMVTITITTDEPFINISIRDNGVGIDPAAVSMFGNGMKNMKKRVEDMRGTFAIKSEGGTTIGLVFPFPEPK